MPRVIPPLSTLHVRTWNADTITGFVEEYLDEVLLMFAYISEVSRTHLTFRNPATGITQTFKLDFVKSRQGTEWEFGQFIVHTFAG